LWESELIYRKEGLTLKTKKTFFNELLPLQKNVHGVKVISYQLAEKFSGPKKMTFGLTNL